MSHQQYATMPDQLEPHELRIDAGLPPCEISCKGALPMLRYQR